MQQKTVLCNDKARLCTTRNVCKQTYVVKSRCNKKTVLCNDKARLYTTKNVCKQTYVVKSRCNKKTVLCNDRTRLYTTRYVCRQTYVVESREKQMQQKNCVMQRQSTTLHDKKRMQVDLCREK